MITDRFAFYALSIRCVKNCRPLEVGKCYKVLYGRLVNSTACACRACGTRLAVAKDLLTAIIYIRIYVIYYVHEDLRDLPATIYLFICFFYLLYFFFPSDNRRTAAEKNTSTAVCGRAK